MAHARQFGGATQLPFGSFALSGGPVRLNLGASFAALASSSAMATECQPTLALREVEGAQAMGIRRDWARLDEPRRGENPSRSAHIIFRPFRAWSRRCPATHSLRCGLHSSAASRLRPCFASATPTRPWQTSLGAEECLRPYTTYLPRIS